MKKENLRKIEKFYFYFFISAIIVFLFLFVNDLIALKVFVFIVISVFSNIFNYSAFIFIFNYSKSKSNNKFFIFNLGGMILRIGLLIIVYVLTIIYLRPDLLAFTVIFIALYFCTLSIEIIKIFECQEAKKILR
ncbi:MAG: hypothetical protein JXA68_11095 [Ignavibacteriales bacterium]|nr:hypothetical protein [Ignavibacteriales bacterium]